jgi:hypothetical protein
MWNNQTYYYGTITLSFTNKYRWQNYFTQHKSRTNTHASWNKAVDCKKDMADSILVFNGSETAGPEILFERVQSSYFHWHILLAFVSLQEDGWHNAGNGVLYHLGLTAVSSYYCGCA